MSTLYRRTYPVPLLLLFITLLLTLSWTNGGLLMAHDDGPPHDHIPGRAPDVMKAFLADQQQPQNLQAMSATTCSNGFAGIYPCNNVDLLAFMPLNEIGGTRSNSAGNDIWGWTDPLTGKEYAIMGRVFGTSFVDISNPTNPVYLGELPTHGAFGSSWRDIKVYANHAFIVSEATNHGMQVFDLTQLRNVTNPPVTFGETSHYNGNSSAHNIAINEDSGYAYIVGASGRNSCSGGLHMVNIQNPTTPSFAGCFSADGYTHDTQCVIYHGPDTTYQGREICFNSNEDTLTIVDVTIKGAPVQLSRTGYAGAQYTHQGWLTEDHVHFLLDDELDERNNGVNTTTYIWDVSDLDNPSVTGTYVATTPAIDHNQYIKGNHSYQANYRAGLRILDITNIVSANLSEVAYFDIYPADDAAQFNGAWSNYPFYNSGVVVVSGIEQGLFVLRPNLPSTGDSPPSVNITNPSDGATVSGTVTVTADASDDNGVTQVEFFVDGASIGVDGDGSNGWSANWDTTAYADGSHTVSATAADTAGQTGSDSISVTVSNGTSSNTMHVGDLDGASVNNGSTWTANITITIHDANENPVSNATVSGSWSNDASGTASCTTNSSGQCTVSKSGIRKNVSSVTFTVDNVTHSSLTYNSSANHDPDGDSNGTSITVRKP